MSDATRAPAPGGTDRIGADIESLTALQAAQRVRAWHETLRTLSAIAEAQVMEAMWVIRREYPKRAAFVEFVAARVGIVAPRRAWLMAQTWDAARRNRNMRRLAETQPDEAIEFARGLVEAGQEERLANLDDDDREIAEALTGTPRQRRSRLRKLLDAERAAATGRHPVDVKRIEDLTAERDAALVAAEAGGERTASPASLTADLQKVERTVATLAEAAAEALRAGAVGESARERLLRTIDLMIGSLDRISAAAMGLDE